MGVTDWFHMETRGCMSDLCRHKPDFVFKIRTGDLCADCLGLLEGKGATDALLRQTVDILEGCRALAVGTSRYQKAPGREDDWPFPIALTRHRAAQQRDDLRRVFMLLDHFDAIVRYVCLGQEALSGRRLEVPDHPALGFWVGALATFPDKGGVGDLRRVAEIGGLVALRNDLRGHGYVLDGAGAYSDTARLLEERLTEAEEAVLPFLRRYHPVVIRDAAITGGSLVVHGERLVGCNMSFPPFELQLKPSESLAGRVSFPQFGEHLP